VGESESIMTDKLANKIYIHIFYLKLYIYNVFYILPKTTQIDHD
jgi:hypothetical protein